MTKTDITLNFEKYLTTKDDIDEMECDICERSAHKKNEMWYVTDFGTRALFICRVSTINRVYLNTNSSKNPLMNMFVDLVYKEKGAFVDCI